MLSKHEKRGFGFGKLKEETDSIETNRASPRNTSGFFRGNPGQGLGHAKCSCPTCSDKQFFPEEIFKSDSSLIVKFPILHHIPNDHSLDILDGIPPENYIHDLEKGSIIHAFIKFQFTKVNNQLFLKLESRSFPTVFDYNLHDLHAIFVKPMNNSGAADVGALRIADSSKLEQIGRFKIPVRHTVTYDDIDFDGFKLIDTLKNIASYHVNCIKRFEELTETRDENSFLKAQELSSILDDIVTNYKEVTPHHYAIALNNLTEIESTETYRYDPLIQLSLTPIRPALEALSQRALVSRRGVEINDQQLANIMKELLKHEGKTPNKDVWLAEGMVERLSAQLESFFKFEPSPSILQP